MPVLFYFTDPEVGRLFTPGVEDLLSHIFDGTAKAVTAELYPLAPAVQVLGGVDAPIVRVNGIAIVSNFAAPVLSFTLGNLTAENAGTLNTLSISALDSTRTASDMFVKYYRLGGGTTTTTTTTTPSPTTTTTPTPSTPIPTTPQPTRGKTPKGGKKTPAKATARKKQGPKKKRA